MKIQLVKQMLDVVVDGALREEQLASDFLVAQAAGDQLGDLELAASDRRCSPWPGAVSGQPSRPGQPRTHLDRQHGHCGGDRKRELDTQRPIPGTRDRSKSEAGGISKLTKDGCHQKFETTAVNTPPGLPAS